MKKVLIGLTMLLSILNFAQEEIENLGEIHKNEIAINVFDFVVAGAVEVQYERFLERNQSLQFNATLFDNYGYWEVGDNMHNNKTHSLAAAYRFYIGRKEHSGVFFYPYAKYMFGTQEVENFWYPENGNSQLRNQEVDMNNLSLGFGLGYKWLFSQRYTLGLDASIGRTFDEEIKNSFSEVEFKMGVSFGVRF